MAAVVGLTGAVVSWGAGGSFTEALLNLMRPASFTLDLTGSDLDTTGFASGAATVESHLPGLRDWQGTMEGYQNTPVNGIAGSVSGAAYSTNVRAWDITLEASELDTTSWSVTSNWKTYAPGLMRWSGTYEALIDDTTSIALPDTSPVSATFTMSSGNYWTGSIFATQIGAAVRVGDVSVVRYSFRGTGNISITGSNAVMTGSVSTQATPVAGSLLLKAHEAGASDKTYTGSAFWKSINVSVSAADVIRTRIGFRGTGALTPA